MNNAEQPSGSHIAWSGLVLERLAQVSAKYTDKVAVRCGEASINYGELEARTNELATQLAMIGVGAGDLVGIGMERSLDMVITVFGVWKAGATFVPLDPDYPELRLVQVLEEATPRVIITDECSRKRMHFPGTEILVFNDAVIGEMVPMVTVPLSSEDIAYVIFTSGSTGRPKGVQISQGALANFLAGIQQSLLMQPSDTLAALTTLSFDISILEITLPLMQGATIVVLDRNVSGDGKQLTAALEAYECTFIQATPATWRLLLDAGWEGKDDLTIICGGENFPRSLAKELLPCSRRIFNAYGPTEATVWATVELVESGEGPVPIGWPLPNYQSHLLDDNLNPVAAGDIGQLYLGGASLANGYLNRPEATAQRFITHPDYGRLYATGDLVRELAGSNLEFVGRVDDQVKIRGFRIEPGDIETQLLELPSVKEALVVLREDRPGVKKLVAYLIPDGGVDLVTAQLRNALKERLPNYMIPHHYVQLASFPRTPNNKVDRKQLPAPESPSDMIAASVHDSLETYLQSVWVEVLGISAIGLDDDFFDLGGDSLQAARITNRIEEWLDELLWPVVIFDAPTIAELADYLRKSFPEAVAAKTSTAEQMLAGAADRVIDDTMIAEFNALIQPVGPFAAPAAKNPPAVFLLCPPRSGSTLLRVMLAGNPRLFSPPEIELLTFNTMGERADVFSGRESYRLEGTIRAVMEIKNCDVDEARAIIGGYEKNQTTIAEFYGIMQAWLDGRLLVDKTPSNTVDLQALRRIEDYFEGPNYIHLTRHPLAMIRSFIKARLPEVFFRRASHHFSPRELAELIWLTCHRNTLTALESVPAERQIKLSFESLTHAPEKTIQQLCGLLNIDFNAAMLEPWINKEKKMTDGLYPESKMMGDPKFHHHKGIDRSAADRWRDEEQDTTLGAPTRALARELGYTDLGADKDTAEREEFVL